MLNIKELSLYWLPMAPNYSMLKVFKIPFLEVSTHQLLTLSYVVFIKALIKHNINYDCK